MKKTLSPRRKFSRGQSSKAIFRAAMEVLESRTMLSATTGAVSGVVYNDVNGNGVQDTGEPGVNGVVVYVDLNNTGVFASGDPYNVTSSTGAYTIPGVNPGTYSVEIATPPGYFQYTPINNAGIPVTITSGTTVTGDNFGLQVVGPQGFISGNVFNDLNGNGVEDNGESGLAGVHVYLDIYNSGHYQAGDPIRLTDSNGNYIFAGLNAGTYTVGVTLPVGEAQTLPGGGINYTVPLASSGQSFNNNFGVSNVPTAPAGQISGVVFNDLNSDGVFNVGEAGISGLTVYDDVANAGFYQTGDPVAVTDAQGNYTLAGLSAGTANIRVLLPAGYVQNFPTNNAANVVTLNSTVGAADENFALLFTPPPGSISGTVYNDTNRDGVQDGGETGAGNVTVYIDTNNVGSYVSGDPVAFTNNQGAFIFSGLAGGTYTVREITPSGDVQTAPANNAGITLTVGTSQNVTGANFGIFTAIVSSPTISGTVFDDVNHDGVQDNGEVGVAGVQVYMDPNYNHKIDSNEQSVFTNANGVYTFTNLPTDPEILRIILPSGAQQTFPFNGIGQYVGKNITQSLTNINFGIDFPVVTSTGSITGTVFNDLNGDHSQTSNEPNLAGQTVYIDLNNDGILDGSDPSAVTTSSGSFTFNGLAPGSYTVDVKPSAGFRQTFPVTGGTKVNVVANQTVSAGKFGVTTTAYVGGILFNDTNGNGVQNTGEGPIAGWTVYIDLNNSGKFVAGDPTAVSATTSVGYWYFRGVAAGTYTIRAIPPAGYSLTKVYTITLTSGEMITNGTIGAKKG